MSLSTLRGCTRPLASLRHLAGAAEFGSPAANAAFYRPALFCSSVSNRYSHHRSSDSSQHSSKFRLYHALTGVLIGGVILSPDVRRFLSAKIPWPGVVLSKGRPREDADENFDPVAVADGLSLKTESPRIADDGDGNVTEKKKKVGFRDRKIIEYENRIRAYSTPDKVFRYFATLQSKAEEDSNCEVFMTPEDFVRSLTPGCKQPEGLGLDQFHRIDPKKFIVTSKLPHDSIFYKLGENGLITFSDYLFLLTMLSTPPRHFEIAFKMFDFDGDGNVDVSEFERVQSIMRSRCHVGKRHRDHSNTGSVVKPIQPALTTFFFGPEGDRKLTIQRFMNFQQQLQREILSLEFHRYRLNSAGKMNEVDFADCLLTYAGFSDSKVSRMKKRVKKAYPKEAKMEGQSELEQSRYVDTRRRQPGLIRQEEPGISFHDFVVFFNFLNHINEVDVALTFYHVAGSPIDKVTFRHVARTVAGLECPKHVVDVIFCLFDEDMDEHLSHTEFISVMKQRGLRGLEKPRDTGLTKLLSAMWKCSKISVHDTFFSPRL